MGFQKWFGRSGHSLLSMFQEILHHSHSHKKRNLNATFEEDLSQGLTSCGSSDLHMLLVLFFQKCSSCILTLKTTMDMCTKEMGDQYLCWLLSSKLALLQANCFDCCKPHLCSVKCPLQRQSQRDCSLAHLTILPKSQLCGSVVGGTLGRAQAQQME